MVAEAMEVIGTWHFESEPVLEGAFELDGTNGGGVLVDDGFLGRALSFPAGARAMARCRCTRTPASTWARAFASSWRCARRSAAAAGCCAWATRSAST